MSARRPDRITRIDRATAERIFGGNPVDPQAGPDALVRLLAAAAAPAVEPGALAAGGEIAGEEAAVAAFLRAHLAAPAQPRRDLMIKTALAKVLTMKIAAAALAAVTAGGVWVATETSALRTFVGGAASGASPAGTHASAVPAPVSPADRAAYGIASVAGVCQAYLAESKHSSVPRPKITHEFGALIAAAGGTEAKAASYCRDLLRALRHRYPAGLPAHLPTKMPAGSPAPLPTSLPITLPTSLPTILPTSPPVPVPTILPTKLPLPSQTILPTSLPIPHPDQ
jgi:hypothetical protein